MEESSNHSSINLLKKNYFYKKELINNIKIEIDWLNNIINLILEDLTYLESRKIISSFIFEEYYNKIKNILVILRDKKKLSIRSVSNLGSYIIGIKLSKIRLSLLKIIQNIGCTNINIIVKLYFNIDFNSYLKLDESKQILEILNKISK